MSFVEKNVLLDAMFSTDKVGTFWKTPTPKRSSASNSFLIIIPQSEPAFSSPLIIANHLARLWRHKDLLMTKRLDGLYGVPWEIILNIASETLPIAPVFGVKSVSRRAHRTNDVPFVIGVQRLSQTSYVDIHRSWLDINVLPPHCVQQRFS